MAIRFAILTISDRSAEGRRADKSGPKLYEKVLSEGWLVIQQAVIADEIKSIKNILINWANSKEVDIILTTGGTGFSPRDVTPEATIAIIERPALGISEAMRTASMQITPHSMLSRASAGIRKNCLIVNLPGNPKGALENLQVILPVLPHAVQLLQEDPQAEAGHKRL